MLDYIFLPYSCIDPYKQHALPTIYVHAGKKQKKLSEEIDWIIYFHRETFF